MCVADQPERDQLIASVRQRNVGAEGQSSPTNEESGSLPTRHRFAARKQWREQVT